MAPHFSSAASIVHARESALKGGERGPAIVPGNSSESRIARLIAGVEKPSMPMDGTKLTPEQISAIKDWIDQGAPWDAIERRSAARRRRPR